MTREQTERIFGNVIDLRAFQISFLASLEAAFQLATPTDQSESSEMRRQSYSQIKLGELFIEWAPKFEIYSDYCNNFCLAQVRYQSPPDDQSDYDRTNKLNLARIRPS